MRMVKFQMRRFRRFESAEINIDAPVIALVGPNESGKTTLLNALTKLHQTAGFDPRDATGDLDFDGRVLEALYLLDAEDRETLVSKVPAASEVRWYHVWRNADGSTSHGITPPLLEDDEIARSLKTLNALRGEDWDQVAVTDLANLVASARATFGREPSEYTKKQLSDLTALSERLLDYDGESATLGMGNLGKRISQVAQVELIRRTQESALLTLQDLTPRVLAFTEDARTLHTKYNLDKPAEWTEGLKNLAVLGEFNLDKLNVLAKAGEPQMARLESLLRRVNIRLSEKLLRPWSQAGNLDVNLRVLQYPWLRIFIGTEDGDLYQLDDRSDGLRTFVALVAFLAKSNPRVPPILAVDEADIHLHWDAQADLINLFHTQDLATQIVYSTHSPGCLPHDLGHGVRAVVPDPDQADRSNVQNWIWESDAGFRPLLYAMGASTAAVTPHRFAVATEGVADFILLPSLLKQATGAPSLPYQIVPGLSMLKRSGVQRLNSESDTMAYLTDGDQGGKDVREKIKSAGIPDCRIFSLPDDLVLEDLVAGETLEKAVRKELHRSGHKVNKDMELPKSGRAAYLKDWFECADIPPPSKPAVASRVLELAARDSKGSGVPLLEERHAPALQQLHKAILNALWGSSSTSD